MTEIDDDPNPRVQRLPLYRIIKATNGLGEQQLRVIHSNRLYRGVVYPGGTLVGLVCRLEWARSPFYGLSQQSVINAVGQTEGYTQYNLDITSVEVVLPGVPDDPVRA